MKFLLEPKQITYTATSLEVEILPTIGNQVEVKYTLRNALGSAFETGNKMLPISALALLSQQPMDLQAFNQVLAEWGITATEQTE